MCLGTAWSCKLKDILWTMPTAFWPWLETARTHGWTQRDRASQNTFCSQNKLTVISLGSSLSDSKEGSYPKKKGHSQKYWVHKQSVLSLCSSYSEAWWSMKLSTGGLWITFSYTDCKEENHMHAYPSNFFLWREITLFLSSSVRLKTLQKVFSINFI